MDFRNNIVKNLQPYTPGEQPQDYDKWIKLNTNEFPFSPSKQIKSFLKTVPLDNLKKYPSPSGEPLKSTLSEIYNIPASSILVSNGSDESLQLICRAFLDPQDRVSSPQITYSLYPVLVHAVGATYQEVKMKNKYYIDLNALEKSKSKIVFLSNPNANTGEYITPKELAKFISRSSKLWIIDEAYNDFVEDSNASMISFAHQLKNLIVTKTFSKSYGLAGIRLGFLVCSNLKLIQSLYSLKDSYNINYLAIQMGDIAVKDHIYYQKHRRLIIQNKKYLNDGLKKLNYLTLDSQANFILAKPAYHSAKHIYEFLKRHYILVRYFPNSKISDFIRISIGTKKECRTLLETFKECNSSIS